VRDCPTVRDHQLQPIRAPSGRAKAAEPSLLAGSLASMLGGGAAHGITRRQEGPTHATTSPCPDSPMPERIAKVAARRQGDREAVIRILAARDQPGELGSERWGAAGMSDLATRFGKTLSRAARYGSSATGGSTGETRKSFRESSRRFIVDEGRRSSSKCGGGLCGQEVAFGIGGRNDSRRRGAERRQPPFTRAVPKPIGLTG